MTSRSGETRISDERLQELIVSCRPVQEGFWNDLHSALRELAATRREGWVMVPVEPTAEMKSAGKDELYAIKGDCSRPTVTAIYRAMLAAVEKP